MHADSMENPNGSHLMIAFRASLVTGYGKFTTGRRPRVCFGVHPGAKVLVRAVVFGAFFKPNCPANLGTGIVFMETRVSNLW